MEMETTTKPVRDGFSWHRIGELAAFYRPTISRQILAYACASLLSAIITLLPLAEVAQLGLFSIIWTALPLIYDLAPLAFCKSGDSRIVERLIPASPCEKYTFMMLYFLVVMPIVIYTLPEIAMRLYKVIPAIQTEAMNHVLDIRNQTSGAMFATSVLTSLATVLTCLFTIYYARTNRTLKGVLSVFAVQIAVGIMGAIWGMTSAFKAGMQDGLNGTVRDEAYISDLQQKTISELMHGSTYISIIISILSIYVIIMLWLNYRVISKRNL